MAFPCGDAGRRGRRARCRGALGAGAARPPAALALLLLALALLLGEAPRAALAAKKPFIATVTLAGGGADIIGPAVESVLGFADAVILLDTGIKDDTVEVARKAAGKKLTVEKFPWPGSFSEARNAALNAAERAGASWAFILDTDERIVYEPKKFDPRAFLSKLPPDVTMVNVWHTSQTYKKPRIFRMPLGGEFNGPTHEWYRLEDGAKDYDLDNSIMFSELDKDDAAVERKARRDADILLKETGRIPDDQRWWYYLGDAYSILGDCRRAIKAWDVCTGMHGWDEEGAWCMYRAAECHLRLKQPQKSIDALARGMLRHSGLPELPWYAGWVSYHMGNYEQAKAWSYLAISLGCYKGMCVDRIGFTHPPAKYEGPLDVLRWALLALGDEEGSKRAKEDVEKAMAMRKMPNAR